MADEEDIIDNLILQGALQPAGIDLETGEMLYNFTESLKEISPELHNEFSTYFSTETMALWENGFIDMDVTDKNPLVSLTPKALDKEAVEKLDKSHRYTLKEIVRILMEKGN